MSTATDHWSPEAICQAIDRLRTAATARPTQGITPDDAPAILDGDEGYAADMLWLAVDTGSLLPVSRLTIDEAGQVGQQWRYFAFGGRS